MLLWPVKKEKKLLTDYRICEIDIEKSSTAKYLEKTYSCEWGFNQDTNLDPFFHLRACITKPVKIPANKIIPIPTGIYPALKNPNFRIEVNSFTDLVYEQGLSLADGVSTFEYTFRNEIWLLIKNNFEQAQTIQPTQKIATFSVNYRPRMVINYVDQIEDIAWKNSSAKSYIQKLKKKLNPEVHDIKKFEPDVEYGRAIVEQYTQGGISTYLVDEIDIDGTLTATHKRKIEQVEDLKEPTGVKPSES